MADKDINKDISNEYEQYSQQASGRLFSSAMFGFNKEEVLEYLEEMADENYQRQEETGLQIQRLNSRITELENELENVSVETAEPSEEISALLEEKEAEAAAVRKELEISRAASQQAEGELISIKQSLQALKQENAWLRQEATKADTQISSLHKQLEEITEGQWEGSQDEIAQLKTELEELKKLRENDENLASENEEIQNQLEEALERIEWFESQPEDEVYDENGTAQVDSPVKQTAAEIINEAYLEADRIRNEAIYERDRVQRQMRNSTGDLAESINNLRTEISGMEGDVGDILELVQAVLADVLNSLGRAEQNLQTFGTQIERFPAASPPVPKPQVLYFQPNHTVRASSLPQDAAMGARRQEQVSGTGSLRRILPSGTTSGSVAAVQSFKPSYTAQATALQEVEAPVQLQTEDHREQLKDLADNLVETLTRMLSLNN